MEKKRNYNKLFIFIGVCLISSVVLTAFARIHTPFANWYTEHIYPLLVTSFSRIFSIFPFSVAEILLYLIITYVIVYIVIHIFYHVKKRKNPFQRKFLRKVLVCVVSTLSIMLLIFTLTAGINYHHTSFPDSIGLEVRKHTKEELVDLCKHLIKETNRYSKIIPKDKNNLCVIDSDTKENAVKAMKKLGENYMLLSGYYPRPKPVLFSEILSYQFTLGIYSPFTLEANYNQDTSKAFQPATMCHELSHLKGFMKEDDSEFIAYLACTNSDDYLLRYSGNLMALTYAMNALYNTGDTETYFALRELYSEQVNQELRADSSYWDHYRGPIATVSNKINDTYLKANAQKEGAKSYGYMVDLLLEYYLTYVK